MRGQVRIASVLHLQNPSIAAVTLAAAGVYNVTVTAAGCTSAAGSTTVVVNAVPATPTAANNGPLCVGATLNLTTPLVAGATYAWTGPNSFSSAVQNPNIAGVTLAAAGVYNVTVTVGRMYKCSRYNNGCCQCSTCNANSCQQWSFMRWCNS